MKRPLDVVRVVAHKCYDRRWQSQGEAVEVLGWEKRLVRAKHLCASDGYNDCYGCEKLLPEKRLYHFCGTSVKRCPAKLTSRDRREVVHIDSWKVVTTFNDVTTVMMESAQLVCHTSCSIRRWAVVPDGSVLSHHLPIQLFGTSIKCVIKVGTVQIFTCYTCSCFPSPHHTDRQTQ